MKRMLCLFVANVRKSIFVRRWAPKTPAKPYSWRLTWWIILWRVSYFLTISRTHTQTCTCLSARSHKLTHTQAHLGTRTLTKIRTHAHISTHTVTQADRLTLEWRAGVLGQEPGAMVAGGHGGVAADFTVVATQATVDVVHFQGDVRVAWMTSRHLRHDSVHGQLGGYGQI